jgi:hypothetical protein
MKVVYSTQQFAKTVEFLSSKNPNVNISQVLFNSIKEFVKSPYKDMATLGFFLSKEEDIEDNTCYIQIFVDPSFGVTDITFTEHNIYENKDFN